MVRQVFYIIGAKRFTLITLYLLSPDCVHTTHIHKSILTFWTRKNEILHIGLGENTAAYSHLLLPCLPGKGSVLS